MAKNWKKLVPTEPEQSFETDLKQSLQDLLQLDDTLKSLLKEREDLELEMKKVIGIAGDESEPNGKIFDQPIDSFQTKRKQDNKLFKTKRKLEEKIANKKLEYKHWETKRNKLKIKTDKTKKIIERVKAREDSILKGDFLKDDLDAKWLEQRNAFKNKITKKIKDTWSENRDKKKMPVVPKIKKTIVKKIAEKIKKKPKVKKAKEQWEIVRDKKKEAKKLKAIGDKKWEETRKKSMVASFDVFPKEVKEEFKKFEDRFKKSIQKEKDSFEEKQQKLKDKLKAKDSLTSKKEQEQKEVNQKKRVEEKREEDRQQRKAKLREEKKNEQNREQKREQRREERKNRKEDKYA